MLPPSLQGRAQLTMTDPLWTHPLGPGAGLGLWPAPDVSAKLVKELQLLAEADIGTDPPLLADVIHCFFCAEAFPLHQVSRHHRRAAAAAGRAVHEHPPCERRRVQGLKPRVRGSRRGRQHTGCALRYKSEVKSWAILA